MDHEVDFILDRHFGGDLWALSRSAHVWIVDSPENEVAAHAVWARETPEGEPSWRGVSTFEDSEDVVENFYGYLSTIEDHHGSDYEHSRPWDAIRVIGLSADRVRPERIADELGHDGLVLEREPGGFAIRHTTEEDPR